MAPPILLCIAASILLAAASAESPQLDSAGFLADMRRGNEADSDHRTIMTPEFRLFCVNAREHTVCCMAYLFLFVCAYAVARRACLRLPRAAPEPRKPARTLSTRYLVAPYSAAFRARQISLIISAAGLAAAAMTAILLAATVALANAMEHGDPHALGSWRTWLLPSTLLSPADVHAPHGLSAGPRVAHDFPPVLRRLWFYQSFVSVTAAVFLVPLGLLFERTPRSAAPARRLASALLRWLLAALLLTAAWEAATRRSAYLQALGFYRPLAHTGATVRYSLYHAASIFASLPAVLVLVPRGTWALFSWLRCCVGQKNEVAHIARLRCTQLRADQRRIEQTLQQAIGSWKWAADASAIANGADAWVVDSSSDDDDYTLRPPPPPPTPLRSLIAPRIAGSAAQLPPAHPGLAASRSLRRATGSARLATSATKSPVPLLPKSSSASLISYLSDDLSSSDDGAGPISIGRAARLAQQRRQRDREREMLRLTRQIKKCHAQLLFIRAELARMGSVDLADCAPPRDLVASRSALASMAGGASSVLLLVTASLCWLLVALQVARGALSAIFVGEPDLTHNFTYFTPALSALSRDRPADALYNGSHLPAGPPEWSQLAVSPLVTVCQIVSAMLLFTVVMFGLLSMTPPAAEGSVIPARLLPASHFVLLLQARQWSWLPRLLLPPDFLAAADPRPAVASLEAETNNAVAPAVAGNVSRVFFSSSADLTSYYRELQRQESVSPSAPAMLVPGGSLPESFFQSRVWGRRVFLLWTSRSARPLSPASLLAYTWLVCSLAMTWPSVLRTAGLISERAYVLPIASLVEPLWDARPADDERPLVLQLPCAHCNSQPRLDAGLLDASNQPLAGAMRWTELPPAASTNSSIVKNNGGVCLVPGSLAANLGVSLGYALCDSDSPSLDCPHYIAIPVPDNHDNSTSEAETLPSPLLADHSRTLSSAPEIKPPALLPLARTVSRRLLQDSLTADTLPRLVIRWTFAGVHHLSPHSSAVLGYVLWWVFPDWVVPMSGAAVDLQLGYTPPAPVLTPLASFGSASTHSEWYGMLRRLERQRTWLPEADNGTPLVLQSFPLHSELPTWDSSPAQQQPEPGAVLPQRMRRRWPLPAFRLVWDAACTLVAQVRTAVTAHLLQAWAFMRLAALSAIKTAGHWLQDTTAETVLLVAARRGASIARACESAGQSVWELKLQPLWQQVLFVSAGARDCVGNVLSLLPSMGPDKAAEEPLSRAARSLAEYGVANSVPPVFASEYWAALASRSGGPALQRLQPQLWPDIYADYSTSSGCYSYDPQSLSPMLAHSNSSSNHANHAKPDQESSEEIVAASTTTASKNDAVQQPLPRNDLPLPPSPASLKNGALSALTEQEDHTAPQAVTSEPSAPSARGAWTIVDWLLAAYRVALGILACRAVLGPSRSSSVLLF